MIRVLASGDHHFDRRRRWEECLRVHEWIADTVKSESIDLFISGGDVFEKRSEPEERLAVARWLARVAEQCPVLMVRGNHDALGDLALFAELRTRHPIIVEERAGVHPIAGLKIAALAWPRKAQLEHTWQQAKGRAPTSDELATAAREALSMTLAGLAADGPDLLVAHAMVRGSMTSTGQPLVGCDMEIGLEDLARVGCPVVLGHIHKPQEWDNGNARVWYTGSPRRTAFGETESKSVLVLDFNDRTGLLTDVERVETPCAPMVLLEGVVWPETGTGELFVGDGTECVAPEVDGAEVRLRYTVATAHRLEGRRWAAEWHEVLLEDGALSVQVEERVIPTSTARAPEVATQPTYMAKLQTLWATRGEIVPESTVERVAGFVGSLAAEVA